MKYSYRKIASISNPLIKEAVRIKKRLDKASRAILVEGMHIVEAVIFSKLAAVRTVFVTDSFISAQENSEFLKHISPKKIYVITDNILYLLSDTESPQGIVAVVDYMLIDLEQLQPSQTPLFVVCDAVRDPGNIGAIIRASDAFGADCVIVLPLSCDPFNPKAVRATAGSLFNIPVIRAEQDELIEYLGRLRIALYATNLAAENSIYQIDMTKPIAMVFGNEAAGVNEALLKKAAASFRIPIYGKAESLNVAMSASICLYEAMRQRHA